MVGKIIRVMAFIYNWGWGNRWKSFSLLIYTNYFIYLLIICFNLKYLLFLTINENVKYMSMTADYRDYITRLMIL